MLTRSLTDDGRVIIPPFAVGRSTKRSRLDVVRYDAERLSDELGDEFCLVVDFRFARQTFKNILTNGWTRRSGGKATP